MEVSDRPATSIALAPALLRPERLSSSDVRHAQEPFPYVIATDIVVESAAHALRRTFPLSEQAGFIPYESGNCGAEFNQVVAEITSKEFADALGDRIGVTRMSELPVLVTVCSRLNKRHGTIHTDSRSKVASALLYLNEDWVPGSAGSLRMLARIDDIESLLTPEIPPLFGTLVAFRRTDRSFHGHLPFEGERRVIQFAWLVDRDALDRKTRRGRANRLFKRLFGPLDRWFGSRRSVNKSHPD